jgi:hypothetical protein
MVLLKSVDQFELVAWMVHRLAKILAGVNKDTKVRRNGAEP